MISFILSLIAGFSLGLIIAISKAKNEIKQLQKSGDNSTQIQIASINNKDLKD